MGKTIHSEARTLILKVLTFFENEKANKRFIIPVDQAIKRACAATGVSKRTLMNIKNQSKVVQQNDPPVPTTSSGSGPAPIPKLSTPGKKRRTSAKKIELDNFDLCALKNIVNNFYTVRKEVPTLKKILAAAKTDLNFPGGITTLRLILINHLGYKFKKCKNMRHFLIQKPVKDRLQEIEEREFIISLGGEESSSETEINESDTMSGIEEINYSSEND